MKKSFGWYAGATLAFALLVNAGAAHAQATRTWVSGVGDDVNPCSRTAPCKTFAGAISKTAIDGIINCLDSGGFGSVTITKSITIECVGVVAGVLAAGANGITVNSAGSRVILRGLSIEGVGSGLVGVNVLSAASVLIDNCKIYGFNSGTAAGVLFAPSAGGQLFVSNSSITDNGQGTTGGGVVVRPPASVRVSIAKSDVNNNSNGILSEGIAGIAGVSLALIDSMVTGNGNVGVTARGPSSVMMERVTTSLNGTGILSDGPTAQVLASNSTIFGNSQGVQMANGGNGFTYVTNHLNANATDGGFPSTLSQR